MDEQMVERLIYTHEPYTLCGSLFKLYIRRRFWWRNKI